TYWVDGTNGNDVNGCNDSSTPLTTTAKRTIAAGIGCMLPGNTLNIRAGTYDERITEWTLTYPKATSWSNASTIQAAPGETVTIRPSVFNDLPIIQALFNTNYFLVF